MIIFCDTKNTKIYPRLRKSHFFSDPPFFDDFYEFWKKSKIRCFLKVKMQLFENANIEYTTYFLRSGFPRVFDRLSGPKRDPKSDTIFATRLECMSFFLTPFFDPGPDPVSPCFNMTFGGSRKTDFQVILHGTGRSIFETKKCRWNNLGCTVADQKIIASGQKTILNTISWQTDLSFFATFFIR